MKNSLRLATVGFAAVVVAACNLVSGPHEPDPVLVEWCLAWCERRDECDGLPSLDCERSFVRECEVNATGLYCRGGEERIEECVASMALQSCEDVLRTITTEACDDLCGD
jgi:hypothetical protein